MNKIWIDPPSGYLYDFPKVWDKEQNPNLIDWLDSQGYPTDIYPAEYRMWEYTEEDDEETNRT